MLSDPPNNEPTLIERYRLVRGQIEFEDGLTAQRLSWFVAAQSFLFTAYAITLNAPPAYQSASPAIAHKHLLLVWLIPTVAGATCLLIYCTIIAGLRAQAHLRRLMPADSGDPGMRALPPIQGRLSTRIFGMVAPLGLPPVFMLVWMYLLVDGLH